MNHAPLFSRSDADRILKRASEIEGSGASPHLSVDELRAIAGESGLGLDAVERAITEAREALAVGVPRPPVQKWGLLVTHLSTVREIPVQISSDQLMRAVRLFQVLHLFPSVCRGDTGGANGTGRA